MIYFFGEWLVDVVSLSALCSGHLLRLISPERYWSRSCLDRFARIFLISRRLPFSRGMAMLS